MANVWFTSDTHFDHKRIMEFCPKTRFGESPEEMTELLITKWNDDVAPNDTVYHIGDVSWAGTERTIEILGRLNGHKYLILGNHDKGIRGAAEKLFVNVSTYMSHKIDRVDVVMFHFPIVEWDKMHYGSFHLFGHVHGKNMGIAGKAMDVGIDARPRGDMGLFSWDEVREYMKDRPILDHH